MLRTSDAAEETAGIEGVDGVKLALDGLHEGKGVAGGAPGVEGEECSGAMENNEEAAHFFEIATQIREGAVQVVGGALEAKPAKTCGVHQGLPTKMGRVGGAADKLDGAPEISGESADFGDGVFCASGKRPNFLPGIPSGGRSFGDFRLAESAQVRGLRIEAGFRTFKKNVDCGRNFSGEVRLNCNMGKLGILDSKDQLLRFFGIDRGNRK